MASIIRKVTDTVGLTTPQVIHTSTWPDVPAKNLPNTNVVDYTLRNDFGVPDSKVLVIDGPTGRETTRGQLVSRSRQVGWALRNKLKRKEHDAVCVFSPNSDTYQIIVLGILTAGLVATPSNAMYGADELEHQLAETGSVTLIVHPALLPVAIKAAKLVKWTDKEIKERIILAVYGSDVKEEVKSQGFLSLDDLLTGNEMDPVKVNNAADRVAVMSFSSGTTGKAKAVQNTHMNMIAVQSISRVMELGGPENVNIVALPMNHIYAFALNVLLPISLGQAIVVVPRFEPESYFTLVQKYKCNNLWIVPPIALLTARHPLVQKFDLSSIKFFMSGAAPLGAELQKEVSAKLPNANANQGYGLSEMSPVTHYGAPGVAPLGSIGRLLPNLEARLVDPITGKDVAERGPEHTGELWVRGPTRMKGYLNRAKETAETIVSGGWLRTGDVAYIDDQDYWYISDRMKELIKYKGYPVPPAELESLLLTHPKVNDSAVIGIWSEEEVTELPRAYIVLAPGAANDDPKAVQKEVIEWVASKVAKHKQLRGGVRIVKEIPKSPSGKILRRILKDEAKAEATIKPKL